MSANTNITIRPVATRDLVAVRTQLVETWHATYDSLYGPEKVRDITARWHSLIALAAQIDVPDSAFLLAEQDGIVLASSYAELRDTTAKLYRLYVHPRAQGRNIARQLMAETFARFPTATHHSLEVGPQNARAIAFYEREGFRRVGEIADVGERTSVAALSYERYLT